MLTQNRSQVNFRYLLNIFNKKCMVEESKFDIVRSGKNRYCLTYDVVACGRVRRRRRHYIRIYVNCEFCRRR